MLYGLCSFVYSVLCPPSISHSWLLNDFEEEDFWKHCGKTCWKPAFSSYPRTFCDPSKTGIVILATFCLCMFSALLRVSQTIPDFYVSFENTVGKQEIACNKQFFLFSKCFWELSAIFIKLKIVVCKKSVILDRVP